MIKVRLHIMLVLLNVTVELSNVMRKKKMEPPNRIKVQLHVMLILHNVKIELSNVILPNVRKVRSNVMLILPNVTMELSNIKKNKRTTECDKSTITCDINTV